MGGHRIYHGTRDDIPPMLAKLLEGSTRQVLAWSSPEPSYDYQRVSFCRAAGPLIALPCFWPHLCILCGPFCVAASCEAQDMRATCLILTDSTIEVIEMEHDKACIPGCYVKGQQIRSIPLNSFTDIATDAQDKGCMTCCIPDVPRIRIDTSGHGSITLWGHNSGKELRQLIMNQRDIFMRGGGGGGGMIAGMALPAINVPMVSASYAALMAMQGQMPTAVPAYGGMSAPPKSPANALGELKVMLDQGLITQSEFDAKKKDILAYM